MRVEIKVICVGVAMVIVGLVLFYSIQAKPGIDESLRAIKHTGTFVGLMGIGVFIAGMLLYLISRNQPPPENFGR